MCRAARARRSSPARTTAASRSGRCCFRLQHPRKASSLNTPYPYRRPLSCLVWAAPALKDPRSQRPAPDGGIAAADALALPLAGKAPSSAVLRLAGVVCPVDSLSVTALACRHVSSSSSSGTSSSDAAVAPDGAVERLPFFPLL